MCGSVFLGIFFGALAIKAMRRWSYYRHGGRHGGGHCGAGAGHGCGRGGRRFMYYRWNGGDHGGSHFSGRTGGDGRGDGHEDGPWGIRGGAARPATKPIAEVLRSLELNDRQRQEAAPVLALAQEWIGHGGPRIEAALLVVAGERFEPLLVEALLDGVPEQVRREVVDGLEHLHTILIAEQREQLRTQLSRSKPATPAAGSTGGGSGSGSDGTL